MAKKSYVKADEIQIKGNQIFSPVRSKWLPLTPEERVRQEYLFVLTSDYGYAIDQISEEMDVAGRGSAQARADFVIWRSAQDRTDQKPPFIIVECKSDNVTIKAQDYAQGEHYARMTDAPFFVTHMRAFTPRNGNVLPDFLLSYFEAKQEDLLHLVKWSTTVQSINKEELESFPVPLPPISIQKKIVSSVNKSYAEINNCEVEYKKSILSSSTAVEQMILGMRSVKDI